MTTYLTPQQVAEQWQCSPEHVQRLCRSGALAAWRLSGWRITPAAVEAYERAHTAVACRPVPSVSVPSASANPPAIAMDGDYLMVVPGPVPWRSEVLPERPAAGRRQQAKKKATSQRH